MQTHAAHLMSFVSFFHLDNHKQFIRKKEIYIYIIYVKIQKNPRDYSSGRQVKEEIAPLLQKGQTGGTVSGRDGDRISDASGTDQGPADFPKT